MSENNNPPSNEAGSTATTGSDQENQSPAVLQILTQYVKDLSFENPNAPMSLRTGEGGQNISVNANVNVQQLGKSEYEVGLAFQVQLKREETVSFLAELNYCGVFRIENIPEESLRPVLLIEAPRQLFPFARRVLADATRDGGFPPLLLDPIDFVDLYRRNMANQGAGENAAPSEAGDPPKPN